MTKKIPTAAEVREYLKREEENINSDSYVIEGPKFPGENVWKSKSTLQLLEAVEIVGTLNEKIWKNDSICRRTRSSRCCVKVP